MGEIDRSWNENFKVYTDFIVNHPNYSGLFYERGKDNNVKWVVTGKSANGKTRQAWWDNKCKEYNIPIQKGCYAVIARLIHPTGLHVCQCCGKSLSIKYEYPNKNLLANINKYFNLSLEQSDMTIATIIYNYCQSQSHRDYISSILKIPNFPNNTLLVEYIYQHLVDKCSKHFSPGVMSNSPDRFDGFHSDGLCCREETDKGRHHDNMRSYTQDRRAYEEWADGDYNLANRLMGEFAKENRTYICPQCGNTKQMSADHIGPISLGFCHSKWNFAPLCKECNSSKNNRFTKQDVDRLLYLESNGIQVVSWHAKYIWDTLKHTVQDDDSAKALSSIMLKCHQNVLYLFSKIYKDTGKNYLSRFLHPDYSFVDYRFENFDPFDWSKLKVISEALESKNKQKNSERYVRIAFESLQQFEEKDNRKTIFYLDKYQIQYARLIRMIKCKLFQFADIQLKQLIILLCDCIREHNND